MSSAARTRAGLPPMRDAEPMHDAVFAALADEVAAVCERRGVPVRMKLDRERLDAALWGVVHPDLAGTSADPYLAYYDAYYGDDGEG